MKQTLPILGKMKVYLQNWIQFFAPYSSDRHDYILLVACIDKFKVVLSFQNF